MFKRIFLPLVLLAALTACQSTATVQSQPTSIPATSTPPPTQVVLTPFPPTDTPQPPPTQPEPSPTHIRVDLTPAQLAAISALSQDKGIPADQIQLVSTEAADWDNGCLGIVIPGVLCTQGPVPGFKIVLSGGGTPYEYHTNQDGSSVLLATSPFVRIGVRLPDNSLQIVSIDILRGRNITPTNQGFMPQGGVVGDTVYALGFADQPSAVAVDASGTHALDFIQKTNYGLAVWPGSADRAPRLAWGTQLDFTTMQTSLLMSAPDGNQLETLITETVSAGAPPFQLVAQRWSADGSSLYYSKEPYGIGGYILYNGASSLYRVDVASKQVTEIIPIDFQKAFICLDAFSPDYTMVADHCVKKVITVRSLDTGHSVTILPPAEVTDFGPLGSAHFSPDGSRLAFTLSKGNPDDEQSWLAVSNGLGSDSSLILTSQPGQSFVVLGWLDDTTLMMQTNSVQCIPDCGAVWTVSVDGSSLNKVSDGSFITFVDGYQP